MDNQDILLQLESGFDTLRDCFGGQYYMLGIIGGILLGCLFMLILDGWRK